MHKRNQLLQLLSGLVLVAILLSACSPAATATPAPTTIPATAAPTKAPAATTAPTQAVPSATSAATKPAATATTAAVAPSGNPNELLLATTTSTQDSGLLDYLLPMFEKEFNVKVKVVAVGSGQAIQLGKDGNADVLLVHSPAAEKAFMDSKDGVRREDVMYNDFVILGPEADPAKIKGIKTAGDAFKTIAAANATFISRGDNSGTDTKEKGIWTTLKIDPKGQSWYVSAGQGMGAVLTMADEKGAYTLSDRATYLTQTKKGLKLKIMVEGDSALLNPYGVIAVDPAKSSKINAALATKFIDWLISVPTMEKVAAFQKDVFGISLFTPSSKPWKDAHPGQ